MNEDTPYSLVFAFSQGDGGSEELLCNKYRWMDGIVSCGGECMIIHYSSLFSFLLVFR